jgi:acyl-CoA reductase-like NAD-dependent aldehyde dehydrogenase
MEEFKIYAAGDFIQTNDLLPVINPFNGESFAHTYLANYEIINRSICKAEECFTKLKRLSSYEKYEILKFISDEIIKNKSHFATLICKEAAKPIKYANSEVDRAAQTFLIAAEECKRISAEVISLDWTPAGKNKEGIVKYFPVGLVSAISPFNFPLNLAVHKIAPAIAAGCPIILKPSSKTPLSTLLLAQIIDKSALPKGAFSVLPCSRTTGNLLVEDNRFKLLTFTGSPEIGWKMKQRSGKKKVVLELGGNAGVIISTSANIKMAVEKAIIGAFAYSGQVCIHTQRILVHESVFETFTKLFCETIAGLKIGDPMLNNTDISCMIDEHNNKRVLSWINEAVTEGAKILCGGMIEGGILLPTVLTHTKENQKVNCEEVFGPVVTIEKFTQFNEAISTLNNSRFGLQAGLFTDSQKEINYAFNNLEVGGVIINDVPTYRADHMPYGGVKDSGLGREGVKYAMMDMLEAKILVKDIE